MVVSLKPAQLKAMRTLASPGAYIRHQPDKVGQWDPEYYDQNYEAVYPITIKIMLQHGWIVVEDREVRLIDEGWRVWAQAQKGKAYGRH